MYAAYSFPLLIRIGHSFLAILSTRTVKEKPAINFLIKKKKFSFLWELSYFVSENVILFSLERLNSWLNSLVPTKKISEN